MIFDLRTDEQQIADDTSSPSPVGVHSSRRRLRAKTTHSRPRIQELIMESRARRAAEADDSEDSLGRSEQRARTTHSGRAKLMEVMRMSQMRKQEQAAVASSQEDSEDDQRISIRPSHTVTSCEESIRMTVDGDAEESMGQAPSLVNWRRGHGFCDEEDTEEPRMSLRYTSDRVSLNPSVSSVSDDIICLCRWSSEEASTCATPRDERPAMKYISSPESSADASHADSESEATASSADVSAALTVVAPTCPKPVSAYRRQLYSVKNSGDCKSTSSTPVAPAQPKAAGGPTSPLTRRCIQTTQSSRPVPDAATQLADLESTQEWRSSLQANSKEAKVNKPLRPERPLISKATPRGRLTQLSSCTKQAITEIPGLVDVCSYRAVVVAPPNAPKSREQTWRRRRLSLNLNL